jgi:hypothetical protein
VLAAPLHNSSVASFLPLCAALLMMPSLFLFCGITGEAKVQSSAAPQTIICSKIGRSETLADCLWAERLQPGRSYGCDYDSSEAMEGILWPFMGWHWNLSRAFVAFGFLVTLFLSASLKAWKDTFEFFCIFIRA